MSERRHNYEDECKREAIRLVTENGDGVGETARNLGINAHMLSRWQREADTKQHAAFPGNGRVSPAQDD
jgi:transposase